MKKLSAIALLCAMFLLTACPVQTKAPVDQGSYKTTGWLEGRWTEQKTNGKTYIIRKGARAGQMKCFALSNGVPEKDGMLLILSTLGTKVFLSAYDKGNDEDVEGYYIFQLIKKNNAEFDLLPVREHLIDYGASSEDIRSFLIANTDGDIYDTAERVLYKKI